MKEGLLAICHHDSEYVNHFVEYISATGNGGPIIKIFTGTSALYSFLEQERADIVLLDEQFYPLEKDDNIGSLVLLTEGEEDLGDNELPCIFQYQSAEIIWKQLLAKMLEVSGQRSTRLLIPTGKTKIIGFFSPAGGQGITTMSMALGKKLAKKENVLYMGFEAFSSFRSSEAYEGQETANEVADGEEGLSELIYYIKEGKYNISLKIKSMIHKYQNLDCLYPVRHYRDLCDLNKEDVKRMIDEILAMSGYDWIILDLGFIGDASLWLMEYCKVLFVPEASGMIGLAKEEAFYRLLTCEGKKEIREQIMNFKGFTYPVQDYGQGSSYDKNPAFAREQELLQRQLEEKTTFFMEVLHA